MADMHLVQAELTSGDRKTIAYIEQHKAKVGLSCRLLDSTDPTRLWRISAVYQEGRPVDYRKGIREHRIRTGDAIPKCVKNAIDSYDFSAGKDW